MSYAQPNSAIVRVFMSEDDRYRGMPLYEVVLDLARSKYLAGATVIRGVEGFGSSGAIHSSRLLRTSEDLPMVVEIADTRDRLAPFINEVETILDESRAGGLVTVEPAHVIFSSRRQALP